METNPFRAQRAADERSRDASSDGGGPDAGGGPGPSAASVDRSLRAWVGARVAGQRWWVRAPLLLVLAWILKQHLDDPMYSSIFAGVNLGFHEAGHAAFMWSGHRILTTAGGTIFEIGIPVVAGAYLLLKQRDPFGAAVCVFWLGTALVGAGIYAADARAQALPLVSPFGPVDVDSHDWTVMLMKFGRLSRDEAIGGFMQAAGKAAMIASLGLGGWVLRVMATEPKSAAPAAPTTLPL